MGGRSHSVDSPRRGIIEEASYEVAKRKFGDIRQFDAIQWAVEESIERDPLAWPALLEGFRLAMSKANFGGLRGRLVFWYTFDREYIHFWHVDLIEDAAPPAG